MPCSHRTQEAISPSYYGTFSVIERLKSPRYGFQLTQQLFRPDFDLYAQAKQDGAIGILGYAIGYILDENLVECL